MSLRLCFSDVETERLDDLEGANCGERGVREGVRKSLWFR